MSSEIPYEVVLGVPSCSEEGREGDHREHAESARFPELDRPAVVEFRRAVGTDLVRGPRRGRERRPMWSGGDGAARHDYHDVGDQSRPGQRPQPALRAHSHENVRAVANVPTAAHPRRTARSRQLTVPSRKASRIASPSAPEGSHWATSPSRRTPSGEDDAPAARAAGRRGWPLRGSPRRGACPPSAGRRRAANAAVPSSTASTAPSSAEKERDGVPAEQLPHDREDGERQQLDHQQRAHLAEEEAGAGQRRCAGAARGRRTGARTPSRSPAPGRTPSTSPRAPGHGAAIPTSTTGWS